jgi:hypothetical protein
MSDKTADKLAAIAAEAEAAETDQTDRPIPAHVTVGRPNRARANPPVRGRERPHHKVSR